MNDSPRTPTDMSSLADLSPLHDRTIPDLSANAQTEHLIYLPACQHKHHVVLLNEVARHQKLEGL